MGYYFCTPCCLVSILHSSKKQHKQKKQCHWLEMQVTLQRAINWVTFSCIIPSEVVIFIQYLHQ